MQFKLLFRPYFARRTCNKEPLERGMLFYAKIQKLDLYLQVTNMNTNTGTSIIWSIGMILIYSLNVHYRTVEKRRDIWTNTWLCSCIFCTYVYIYFSIKNIFPLDL